MRSFRLLALIVAIIHLTAAADSAMAQTPEVRLNYKCDPLPKKWGQKIEAVLRAQVDFYGKLGVNEDFCVDVLAFEDREAGYEYMNSHGMERRWVSESGVQTAGICMRDGKTIAIFGFSKDTDTALKTIFHEISHSFVDKLFENCNNNSPKWLHEGLAEYFEHCTIKKGVLHHEMDVRHKGLIKTKHLLGEIDVRSFLGSTYDEFRVMSQTGDNSYIYSYVITTFMIENTGEDFFPELIEGLKDRGTVKSSSDVIDEIYPGGMEAFETDFIEFICN